MKLGEDFWLIIRIVLAVLKTLVKVLGDEDDKFKADNGGFSV